MAGKINVLRKCKIEGVWKMLPLARVRDAKGERIDWTQVLFGGVATVVNEGAFYLEYRTPGGRVRRAVGDHPREAKAALEAQVRVLGLRRGGMEVDDAPQIRLRSRAARGAEGPTIRTIVDGFLAAPPMKLRARSVAKYSNALKSFAAWTKKTHAAQLDRSEIEAFMAWQVRRQQLDASTAKDKAIIVLSVMNQNGASIKMRKGDWPQVTERDPEVYAPALLARLFAVMEPDELVLFQTFRLTGMRDQEVVHLTWDDFHPAHSILEVRKKASFDPKGYKERAIPVPRELVRLLRELHRRQRVAGGGEGLIFPTSDYNAARGQPGGLPDRHMLRRLKRIALRGGLNCGRCRSTYNGQPRSCADAPICAKFGLHKFRHTYATTLLREGVDLVSVQKLLGHSDLTSTRKYLRALEPADLLEKINRTSLARL